MGNLADSTQRINLHTIKYFMNWVTENSTKFAEYTPDDLVEYQLDASSNKERFELLDNLVIPWIRDTEGRVGYKQRHYATIRGFFKRNRVPLPSDPDFQIKNYTEEKVIGDLSVDEAKDIIQNSAIQFKASFLVILQSGMDSQSFEYWNQNGWESLQKQLRNNSEVIRIDLHARRKARNNLPYYTYARAQSTLLHLHW